MSRCQFLLFLMENLFMVLKNLNLSKKNLKNVREIKEIFPIIDITSDVMDVFGKIKAHVQKIGKTTDDMDLLIAATAIANEMTLVTHNTKHFENIPNLKQTDWF